MSSRCRRLQPHRAPRAARGVCLRSPATSRERTPGERARQVRAAGGPSKRLVAVPVDSDAHSHAATGRRRGAAATGQPQRGRSPAAALDPAGGTHPSRPAAASPAETRYHHQRQPPPSGYHRPRQTLLCIAAAPPPPGHHLHLQGLGASHTRPAARGRPRFFQRRRRGRARGRWSCAGARAGPRGRAGSCGPTASAQPFAAPPRRTPCRHG